MKLSASSLFPLRGFVSHANSGGGPNPPGQALHPNWQWREKEGGGLKREEGGVYMGMVVEGQRACPECQSFQATDVMPVPTVGEQRRDQGASFSFPSTVSFSGMNESFRSCSPLCPIIDSDYPDFMLPSRSEEVP